MRSNIINVMVLAWCLASCMGIPEGVEDPPTLYTTFLFNSHYVFPKGSYWIYEEATTHTIDSVYLYRSEMKMINGADTLTYNYQQYILAYRSSLSSDSTISITLPEPDNHEFFISEEFHPDDPENIRLTYMDVHDVGQPYFYGELLLITYEAFEASMDINGKTYNNIKVFRHNKSSASNSSRQVYFAQNVGVIKRELFNGQVWELKRFFINE